MAWTRNYWKEQGLKQYVSLCWRGDN